tara:strand:+ start:2421 stop:2960 length:540 start_codon:yes stop_codon:yes gene_type:complete
LKIINKWLLKVLQALLSVLKRKEEVYIQKTQAKAVKALKQLTGDKVVSLVLIRDTFSKESILGKLYLNDEMFCDTLELPYKDNKRSISSIPVGEYNVRLRYPRESATRDYIHLLVKDVKDRNYILFHIGNSAKDSRGCILVGQKRRQDFVSNSIIAMSLLMKEIVNLGGENIKLIIKNK